MRLRKLRKTVLAVAALLTIPVAAQDLIASQAPIDRKMKAVDSVALQRLIQVESQNYASSIYPDWNNQYAHRYAKETPDSFRIDLRHFCMPTPSRVVTSNFGYRRSYGRMHKGIDVKVYIGDTIRAAFSGKVRIVDYERAGYGNYVVIRHGNGLETIYGHLSRHLVKENEDVKAGEPIGLGGNTGRSSGSHLHFETRLLGEAINPALLFDFASQDVTSDFFLYRKKGGSYASNERGSSNIASIDRDDNENNSNHSSSFFHKVRKGESLYVLARKFGTTVNDLCRINRLSTRSKLRPGQILKLK